MEGGKQVTIQDWLNYIRSIREYNDRRATRREIMGGAYVGFGLSCLYLFITSSDLTLRLFCFCGIVISMIYIWRSHMFMMRYILCITKYFNLENDILSGKIKDISKLEYMIPGIFNEIMKRKYRNIAAEFYSFK